MKKHLIKISCAVILGVAVHASFNAMGERISPIVFQDPGSCDPPEDPTGPDPEN